MLTIGIDIGGTNIETGLVHDGKVVERKTIDAQARHGLKPQLKLIEATIFELLSKGGFELAQLSGIGMSIPGIVDCEAKKVLVINDKFNDVIDMDLAQWAKSTFNLPLAMDNDARCALIGEWQYGSGQGCNNLVMVTLGTGLGTAALIEGRVLRGSHYIAGILGGHFIIDRNGLFCNCGNKGCAEAQSSTWNLSGIINKFDGAAEAEWTQGVMPGFKLIVEKALSGDTLAIAVLNHCMDIWTETIVNLIYAYDPEKVVMAGGIMKSAEIIIPYIRRKIRSYGWAPFDKIEIVRSSVFAEAAILSAEYLIN
ncbi:MAG: ROK family protein [Prevotellaceae bacterium]|jgi:glucokinase|nr:ROK family protein [Prevotellaceae bacterium]